MKRSNELPKFIEPMLAKVGSAFDSEDFQFEIKWDGTRAIAFVDEVGYRIVNRRGANLVPRYPELAFLNDLPRGTVLDGEIIVLEDGKPSFALLMSREQARTSSKIKRLARTLPATYIVFDLLYDGYKSVMSMPLSERRKRLRAIVKGCRNQSLAFSDHVVGSGTAFYKGACDQMLEGVVAKALSSKYIPGARSDSWIKIKRNKSILCAVIGYLPEGKNDFRSLLLAARDDAGDLQFVGKVGTGFDAKLRAKVNALIRLSPRARPLVACPEKAHWIEPGFFCMVDCMEVTANGHLRMPVFKQLVET